MRGLVLVRSSSDPILPHLDLFVLPSFTEGMPNVVLEAFAAGVPVVATAVGGTPELVRQDVNGLLVPPGDACALTGALLALLASPELRRLMGPADVLGNQCDDRIREALVVPVILHDERRADFRSTPVTERVIEKDDITPPHGFLS